MQTFLGNVLLFSFTVMMFISVKAQERLRPGLIYQPGDTIFAPTVGLISVIPEGWAGVLPHQTEMFLLMSQEHPEGSIYAFAFDDTKEELRERWTHGPGLEVENNIKLVRSSEVFDRGEVIAADLKVENSTNNAKGYMEAKCSNNNKCLVLLLITLDQYLEKTKAGLRQFMDNSTLSEPSMGDIYENLDWTDFFENKYLATRQINPYEKAKRKNQLWLCPDGTFRSYIKIKGFANISKQIKGNRTGTWEAEGIGRSGTLRLYFKKMSESVEVPTELREDQLFINDIRYFVMQNDACK